MSRGEALNGFFVKLFQGHLYLGIFDMLNTKIMMIFAENKPLYRTATLKIAPFRKFSHFFTLSEIFVNFLILMLETSTVAQMKGLEPLFPENAILFIRTRIYRKKVTALRKLQKVSISQKCLDRNTRKIEKIQTFTKNFYNFK